MQYTIIFSIIFIFAIVANTEEVEESKLTSTTKRIVDNFEADIANAKIEFDKAIQKAKDKMAASLEREMKSVMRKGDLNGATAIKSLQDKLVNRTGLEEKDMFGNTIEKEPAQGTVQGTFYIKADEFSQVYINGKRVIETTNHRKVFKTDMTLKPGDVLVVSYTNKSGGGGVTAGYLHSNGIGYSTQSSKWRVIKADNPASISVEDIKNGLKVISATSNEDDRSDIKASTKLDAETLESSPNAVGTFILATVVAENDFQQVK